MIAQCPKCGESIDVKSVHDYEYAEHRASQV